MGSHYDAPQTGSWYPDLLVRYPNLGLPRFVRYADDIRFDILLGGTRDDLDVRSLVTGRLFLQSLNDTRQILQEKKVSNVKDMNDLPRWLWNRLVPLEIEKVKSPVDSSWSWFMHGRPKAMEFPYAYWVTVRLRPRRSIERCFRPPVLFNIVQDFPEVDWYNTNFHSVYIHKRDWHDFRFIHATDTHIAWRNDTILQMFEEKFQKDFNKSGDKKYLEQLRELRERYVNFNENFRDFICYANALHRKGKIDFIVLNGDIVDFVHENFDACMHAIHKRPRSKPEPHYPPPKEPFEKYISRGPPPTVLGKTPYYPRTIDNFEFFRELVTAWGSREGILVDEELEVPIFTILGNHDYRINEYPLIHIVEHEFGQTPLKECGTFGLTESEALQFEGGWRTLHRKESREFVNYYEDAPLSYKALINPDRDYTVDLGKHRVVFLDSFHDEGVPWTILQYLFRNKSGKNFVAGQPDSAGFSQGQIDFLANAMHGAKGLVFIATHAPLVNTRYTPHHLLRETEHNRDLSEMEEKELLLFILSNHPEATEIEEFVDEYGTLMIGGAVGTLVLGPVGGLIGAGLGKLVDLLFENDPQEELEEAGWVFGNSDVFKVFGRDDYIAWGVAAHRFEEFIGSIEERVNQDETAVLVLTGHTHKNIEYVVTLRGATEETKFIRFYHDYYIDNTIHGQRPQDFWHSEKLPNYDPKSQKPKQVVWHHHSPLFVQTLSLGPKPSSQKPEFNKAKPIGFAKVDDGRFSLYNLTVGTYELVFVSKDKKKRGVKGINVSDKNTSGYEPIKPVLEARSKEPVREYEKAALKTGIPQKDWGKGSLKDRLVVEGKVLPETKDVPKHLIDQTLDLYKDGIRVDPRELAPKMSGTITIYKAPPPEVGVLLITVKDDLITGKERVNLSAMKEEKLAPVSNPAYLVLSTSPA